MSLLKSLFSISWIFSTRHVLKLCVVAAGLLLTMNHSSFAQFWRSNSRSRPQTQQQSVQQPAYPGYQQNAPAGYQQPAYPGYQQNAPANYQHSEQQPDVQQQQAATTEDNNSNGEASAGLSGQIDKLTLSEGEFDWRHDWWKYLIIATAVLGLILLVIRIGHTILRMFAFIGCLSFAAAAAYFFGPMFTPTLQAIAPWLDFPQCPPLYWSYFVIFLLAYLFATVILWIIKRPFDMTASKKKK